MYARGDRKAWPINIVADFNISLMAAHVKAKVKAQPFFVRIPSKLKKISHPDASWITRFLLYPSILILFATFCRMLYYNNRVETPHYNLVIFDNLLVNLAATSLLFFMSATVLQGSIKKAAQREFLSLLQDSLIGTSIRQSLLTPLTNNNLKETSLIVVKDFTSVSDLFIDSLHEAKEGDTVSILNTWIPQLVEIEEFRSAVKEAWCRGAKIEILMVDPYSTAATLRSESVMNDDASNLFLVKSLVMQCLAKLNQIANQIVEEHRLSHPSDFNFRDNLEVRLYESLPSVSIYKIRVSTRSNSLMLVGMFLHGRLAVHGPQLAIMESNGFVARSFDAEFKQVWDAAAENKFKLCNQGGTEDVARQLDVMRSPDPLPGK